MPTIIVSNAANAVISTIEDFDKEFDKVLDPFIAFINQYPDVFTLKSQEGVYCVNIDLLLLKQQLGKANPVVQ